MAGSPSSPLAERLARTRFAGGLHHLPRVGSTNRLALEAAHAGVRTGVWLADEQTAGRGRGAHTWHSAAGEGLYASALIAPPLPLTTALKLSLSAGLAAQHAVHELTGAEPDIRWPNDLLLGGRKFGGILVEAGGEPAHGGSDARLRYAVVGIGINLNHLSFPPELDAVATSLRRELQREISRDDLLVSLLHALERELTALERESAGAPALAPEETVLARFTRASTWVEGKRVQIDDSYTGTTAGLSETGFLRVRGDDGTLHLVHTGGVREPREPEIWTARARHAPKEN